MPFLDENLQVVRVLFAEESGERLNDNELTALLEDLDDFVDEDGKLDHAVCRDSIRRYLRRTRRCEHGRPQPGHPEYEGERCLTCDTLEYGDRRCDKRRGSRRASRCLPPS